MDYGPKFEEGLRLMLEAIAEAQEGGAEAPLSLPEVALELRDLTLLRGRPPFYAYLGSGLGRGARVMLADGRWLLDFTLGIGVHFFGHGNPDLIETALRAAASDAVMQGNLIFNREYYLLMQMLIRHAPRGMEQCWLSLSGADANENALKLIRQKREGRPGVIAFRGCFHGRTSAMAEITDRPDYRVNQPSTFPVFYLPFYDRSDPLSAGKSFAALREVLRHHADEVGAFVVELVQGEAGFVTAPREFFVPLFDQARAAGVVVWVDEIQTFGRTTELFATQMLDLADFVDVITVGKMLQGSAVLLRRELAFDPNLISGTFSGATVAMAVGRRIVEKLTGEGYYGPYGRIKQIERLAFDHLERLSAQHPGAIASVDGVGAMASMRLSDGSLENTQAFIRRCFQEGLALYLGGHDPACVRIFIPAGDVTEAELAEAFAIMDRCL